MDLVFLSIASSCILVPYAHVAGSSRTFSCSILVSSVVDAVVPSGFYGPPVVSKIVTVVACTGALIVHACCLKSLVQRFQLLTE